jgi:type I restriction enzyme S subunit
MQDSELGPIPRGWRVGLLGEIVEFIKGVSYRSAELMTSKYALVTLKSIARGGGFNSDGFKEFDGRYKESQTLVEGDTVIAQTDITQNAEVVGCPAIVENPFNYEKLIASIDIVKCLSKNENLTAEGVYYFFRDQNFKDYCLSHTNGSTVLHLRSSELPNYKLAIPDKNILKKFCQIVRGINSKIMDNNHQTQTLIKMRDILMPKLMNGELEV